MNSENAQINSSGRRSLKTTGLVLLVVAVAAAVLGTSVAFAAAPAARTSIHPSSTSVDLEGVVGQFNATNCDQTYPSTAYSVTLVTTGGDAPYCLVTLEVSGIGHALVAAGTANGAGDDTVVVQYPTSGFSYQVYNAGTDIVGQLGAGYVSFSILKVTR